MCGNQPVRDVVSSRHCRSVLDRSANTLMLHVKCELVASSTYAREPPGEQGSVIYGCSPLESTTLDNFRQAFAASVREHWHDKLWISPVLPDPSIPPLRCGVEVSFVSDYRQAHCSITLLYEPSPAPNQRNIAFRSFCHRGGVANVEREDMVIAYKLFGVGRADDFDWTQRWNTEDEGPQPFTQNLAAHEFGHYLGLSHRCHSPATANALPDYCIGRTQEMVDNIMAAGNTLSAAHGEPWASRLRRHHYYCDRTWVGSTSPVEHHPGLINSLASGA